MAMWQPPLNLFMLFVLLVTLLHPHFHSQSWGSFRIIGTGSVLIITSPYCSWVALVSCCTVRWVSLLDFCTEMEEKYSHGQRLVSVIKCQTLCPKNSTCREYSLPKDIWLTSAALLIRGAGLKAKAAWTGCELQLMLRLGTEALTERANPSCSSAALLSWQPAWQAFAEWIAVSCLEMEWGVKCWLCMN